MTTPAQINKELSKQGIDGQIVRSPKGYYYFNGCLLDLVPSIYAHNLRGYTTSEVITHIKEHYKP